MILRTEGKTCKYKKNFKLKYVRVFLILRCVVGVTSLSRMQKMAIEASEIQLIKSINHIPNMISCSVKCSTWTAPAATEDDAAEATEDPAAGSNEVAEGAAGTVEPPAPTNCSGISYDNSHSICDLIFLTPEAIEASRNAVSAETTNDIIVSVPWHYEPSPGPAEGANEGPAEGPNEGTAE